MNKKYVIDSNVYIIITSKKLKHAYCSGIGTLIGVINTLLKAFFFGNMLN